MANGKWQMANGKWQMGRVLVNGITVAYEDVGDGDNVLVLVHGHPFNRTMWRPQMEWIGDFNRPRARARDLEGEPAGG